MNTHSATEIARALRKQSTEAEKLLWTKLRDRQMGGFKFRRQHHMGPYFVDFACFAGRLVIELDGGQHAIKKEKDRARDSWLKDEGFEVLRFWDNEVFENLDGVLERIGKRLIFPHPDPLPEGEGENLLTPVGRGLG
jgi:very-short-patch-repair endonuclease